MTRRIAARAGVLRTTAFERGASGVSAVDAQIVALAESRSALNGVTILTSDRKDLGALLFGSAAWGTDAVGSDVDVFPRQYEALEAAMAAFGDDFDLQPFKQAFETTEDMEAYNRVQATERAAGRVQNYCADLSRAGALLAGLPPVRSGEGASAAAGAFASLRDEQVISAGHCRKLVRAQGARSRMEHSYVDVPAGDVHRAVALIHESARAFIGSYGKWISPYLRGAAEG